MRPIPGFLALAALALLGVSRDARAEGCAPARLVRAGTLPDAWQRAAEALVRVSSEPGHPWSCAGGEIELTVRDGRGTLRVAREGEAGTTRDVETPEDVVPLGKALLAVAAVSAPPPPPVVPPAAAVVPAAPAAPAPPATPPAPATSSAPPESSRPSSPPPSPPPTRTARLLLAAGVDARAVAGSSVAWVGPTVAAGVPLGRILPMVSFRADQSVGARPPVDELAVALTVVGRFPVGRVELRGGGRVLASAVERGLGQRHAHEGRLQARVGVLGGVALPAFSFGRIVVLVDADAVVASRDGDSERAASSTSEAPRAWPKATFGGAALLEVPL